MITQEIIGKQVKVVESNNPSNKGITAKIVDETKSTITIKTKNGNKKMIKQQNTFEIENKGQTFLIEGRLLEKRPEERVSLK